MSDDGYTLIEVGFCMVLATILMSTVTWSFTQYLHASSESNTAIEVRAALRNASVRSISQGRTYCVFFNVATRTYTTYVSDCTVAANQQGSATTTSPKVDVQLPAPAFAPPAAPIPNQNTACPLTNACAYFYPRGTAIAGKVVVSRSGSTKVYTISVEGLTSHVSLA